MFGLEISETVTDAVTIRDTFLDVDQCMNTLLVNFQSSPFYILLSLRNLSVMSGSSGMFFHLAWLSWFLAYIRLTVSDSDGLTDSSTSTVRVSNPKDDPPQAQAGHDRVITLPLNHLTLLGNQSTDDNGIMSFFWTLHPSSLNQEVTMQVIWL